MRSGRSVIWVLPYTWSTVIGVNASCPASEEPVVSAVVDESLELPQPTSEAASIATPASDSTTRTLILRLLTSPRDTMQLP
jgi:hypothetical protein